MSIRTPLSWESHSGHVGNFYKIQGFLITSSFSKMSKTLNVSKAYDKVVL